MLEAGFPAFLSHKNKTKGAARLAYSGAQVKIALWPFSQKPLLVPAPRLNDCFAGPPEKPFGDSFFVFGRLRERLAGRANQSFAHRCCPGRSVR